MMEKHLRFEVDGSKAAVGPLTLHRLKALTEFGCMRCGSFKKSRIVVTFAGDWSRLLCNGCYGQLLSIWRTRSPDGSEGLSDEAVERLRGLATNGALERAAVALRAKDAVGRLLSEESFRMLATADALVAPLEQGTDLDWSAGVIMLCKAVEVELGKRLFEPLRAASQGLDRARPGWRSCGQAVRRHRAVLHRQRISAGAGHCGLLPQDCCKQPIEGGVKCPHSRAPRMPSGLAGRRLDPR